MTESPSQPEIPSPQFSLRHLLSALVFVGIFLTVARVNLALAFLCGIPFATGAASGWLVARHPRGAFSGALFGAAACFGLLAMLVVSRRVSRSVGAFLHGIGWDPDEAMAAILIIMAAIGGVIGGFYARRIVMARSSTVKSE